MTFRTLIYAGLISALLLSTFSSLLPSNPAQANGTDVVNRLGGTHRRSTAVTVSRHLYPNGADRVYISNHVAFADTALAAAAKDGPLLLVAPENSRNAVVRSEIARLKPKRIIVLGGSSVVSSSVAHTLKSAYSSAKLERQSGASRYSTAVAASQNSLTDDSVLYIVNSTNEMQQALTAAISQKNPLLYVRSNYIHQTTKNEIKRLQPGKIVIIGNSNDVSGSVVNQIRSLSPSSTLTRISANDVRSLSLKVASQLPTSTNLTVANSTATPDAFVGASIPNSPLILTYKSSLTESTVRLIANRGTDRVRIIGSSGVVSNDVAKRLNLLARGGQMKQQLASGINYFITPHPDDEVSAWSLVQQSEFPVFVLTTQGEGSYYCLKNGGRGSQQCRDRRLGSFHGFLDETFKVQHVKTTSDYELYVGKDSARVIFDLGDGNLTNAEVTRAINIARGIDYGVNLNDNAIIMAAHDYGHSDHNAVEASIEDYTHPRRILREGESVVPNFATRFQEYSTYVACDDAQQGGHSGEHYSWLINVCQDVKVFWDIDWEPVGVGRQGFTEIQSFKSL